MMSITQDYLDNVKHYLVFLKEGESNSATEEILREKVKILFTQVPQNEDYYEDLDFFHTELLAFNPLVRPEDFDNILDGFRNLLYKSGWGKPFTSDL